LLAGVVYQAAGPPSSRATKQPGHQAAGPPSSRATKQPGHQAAPSDPHATPAAARGRRPDSGQRTLARVVSWPVTLRRVRGWLAPWVVLRRWWRAWSTAPPPVQLGLLLDTAHAGQPLYLYIPP